MNQVERLCGLLDEEARVCCELTGVLRAEQEAVVGFRAEEILRCVEERGVLQDRLYELAMQRRSIVQGIAANHGTEGTHASDILPLLPLRPQGEVRGRIRALRGALLEARGLERQNTMLATSSLGHVDELLHALRGLVPGARYGANAAITLPNSTGSLSQRA